MDVRFKFKLYTGGMDLLYCFTSFGGSSGIRLTAFNSEKSIFESDNLQLFNYLPTLFFISPFSYSMDINFNQVQYRGFIRYFGCIWPFMALENPIKHNQTTDLLTPLNRAKPTKKVWGDTPEEQCEYIIKNWELWKHYQTGNSDENIFKFTPLTL